MVPGSPNRALVKLADEGMRCTPGCCGAFATAIGWGGGSARQRQTAVTHPDLAALVSVQWEAGEGPVQTAIDSGAPEAVGDLLYERRWPEYRAQALDAGVRSSTTIPWRLGGLELTVTLCAFRPGLDARDTRQVAGLLGDLTASALTTDHRYREAAAEAAQLDTALRSRPVVDQACGIVMYVLGCSAEEAFDVLRRLSQATNRKLQDLAQAVTDSRGHGIENDLKRFNGRRGSHPGR